MFCPTYRAAAAGVIGVSVSFAPGPVPGRNAGCFALSLIANEPASWKDVFFPLLHDRSGS